MIELDILVKNFKSKDHLAFEELYSMYHKSIYGVIFNMIKDTEIANDLTQDVFIKAWNNSEKYSNKKGRFFTWLLNIAKNTTIDKIRSKSYKNNKKNVSSEDFLNSFMCNIDSNSTTNTIGLKNMVSNLEPKIKNILNLIYFEGFTQKEVSEELNIPMGTVKTRKRNGLNLLKTLFV